MTNLGVTINSLTKDTVSLARQTLSSKIQVAIDQGKRRPCKIDTPSKFFNHMLAGISSRACLNLDLSYSTKNEVLDHSVVENSGLALGRAIRELIETRRVSGLNENGSGIVAFDEALVSVILAFDGRAYTFMQGDIPALKLEFVEDILATSLKQFFEGFAQGASCIVHIQFLAGSDNHHTWEATFKAFGEALRVSLLPCPYRTRTTIGLKGTSAESKL